MSTKLLLSALLFVQTTLLSAQTIGIGTNQPDSRSILDIRSTTKGVLLPRLTREQIASIPSPPEGMMVFCTSDQCLHTFNGQSWSRHCGARPSTTQQANLPAYTWSPQTNMPQRNNALICNGFVLGTDYYLLTLSTNPDQNEFWKFAPGVGTWQRLPDFPGGGRFGPVSFSVGSKGYVGLGFKLGEGYMKDLWEYDGFTGTWLRRADYPGIGCQYAVGFQTASAGYVVGGRLADGSSNRARDAWQYNPLTNSWLQLPNFPEPQGIAGGVAAPHGNGNVYVGTGIATQNWYEFNPTTNQWTAKSPFPGAGRAFASGFAFSNFVFLGWGQGGVFKDFWRYNVTNDSWTQLDDFPGPARYGAVAFPYLDGGVLMAGHNGFSPLSDSWIFRFNPSTGTLYQATTIPPDAGIESSGWVKAGNQIYSNVSGNIGIGTTSPQSKLHVQAANGFRYQDGSEGAGKFLRSDPNGVGRWEVLPPSVWTTTGNNISNANTGNVGIGTSSPNGRLQFNNHINNRILVLNESANNDHNFFGFGINNFTLRYQIADPNQSHVFFAGNAATASGSNELFRIRGNGNVGIRQSNPNAPLQFSNDVGNRKIVLFEVANNDHQFYGLGVTSGTFRYQVPVTADAHVFFASTSASSSRELMRITGNGHVGINQGNPQVPLHFATELGKKISLYRGPLGDAGFGVFGNELRIHSDYNGADITFGFDDFTNGFTERFRVRANGNATLAGVLTQNSDARLKKNIQPIGNATTLLEQLHGYRYNWIAPEAESSTQIGLLAQEVKAVLPELVKEQPNGLLSVNYSGMIPLLLESLREAHAQLKELKQEIQALQQKVGASVPLANQLNSQQALFEPN